MEAFGLKTWQVVSQKLKQAQILGRYGFIVVLILLFIAGLFWLKAEREDSLYLRFLGPVSISTQAEMLALLSPKDGQIRNPIARYQSNTSKQKLLKQLEHTYGNLFSFRLIRSDRLNVIEILSEASVVRFGDALINRFGDRTPVTRTDIALDAYPQIINHSDWVNAEQALDEFMLIYDYMLPIGLSIKNIQYNQWGDRKLMLRLESSHLTILLGHVDFLLRMKRLNAFLQACLDKTCDLYAYEYLDLRYQSALAFRPRVFN